MSGKSKEESQVRLSNKHPHPSRQPNTAQQAKQSQWIGSFDDEAVRALPHEPSHPLKYEHETTDIKWPLGDAITDRVCGTPQRSVSSSDSDGNSMINNPQRLTPPDTPGHGGHSPGVSTAGRLEELSLRETRSAAHARKRSASKELPHDYRAVQRVKEESQAKPFGLHGRRTQHRSANSPKKSPVWDAQPKYQGDYPRLQQQLPKDSGYGSYDVIDRKPVLSDTMKSERSANVIKDSPKQQKLIRGDSNAAIYNMIMQPESTLLTQSQLADEVKGIYSGLVMVEAKCISVDAQQQSLDPKSAQLASEQWQAMIALHRTLLYEHHDFLMATQHPSANSDLRGLASKYCMPARMWEHGIHAFLELLRHRRPGSQEYMVAFIYLAYQMMALLYETVPSFLDTWIECLGDLARYRMAIEEDKETHATWAAIAARWYNLALDRHPTIGRLYHHLGILERPSLRKFFYYAKALTASVPLINARGSLEKLCNPISQDKQAVENKSSAEAWIIFFHANVFCEASPNALEVSSEKALDLFEQQPAAKIFNLGVCLVITNIAGCFEYGSPQNKFRVAFALAVNHKIQSARPSANATEKHLRASEPANLPSSATSPSSALVEFSYACFHSVMRRRLPLAEMRNLLPFVHAQLVWFQALGELQSRLENNRDVFDLCASHLSQSSAFWDDVADFLNHLTRHIAIDTHIQTAARQRRFPKGPSQQPLSEDYLLRGLVWTELYFPEDWFKDTEEDDGSRTLEDDFSRLKRVERVLWLGIRISLAPGSYLAFNDESKQFYTSAQPWSVQTSPGQGLNANQYEQASVLSAERTPAPSSSDWDGDYEMVSTPSESMASSPRNTEAQSAVDPVMRTEQKQTTAELQKREQRALSKESTWTEVTLSKSNARGSSGGRVDGRKSAVPKKSRLTRPASGIQDRIRVHDGEEVYVADIMDC